MKDHKLDKPFLGVLFVVGFIVVTLGVCSSGGSTAKLPAVAAPDRLSKIERKLEEMAYHLDCVGRAVGAGRLTVSARSRGREYFEWDRNPRPSVAPRTSSILGGGSETDAKLDRLAVQLERVAEAVGLPREPRY